MTVQVQGAKVTTSHWTHVTEGCNNKTLQPPPLDEHGHCGEQQYITLHVFLTSPYRSCTNCGIMHYNSACAGPDLVDCGGSSSCLLLLHPSPTVLCWSGCLYLVLSFYQNNIALCIQKSPILIHTHAFYVTS